MSKLEKAITQEHITLDTVDVQFCSNWLKDEIKILFNTIASLEVDLKGYDAMMADRHNKMERIEKLVGALKATTDYIWCNSGGWCRYGTSSEVMEKAEKVLTGETNE